MLKNLHAAALLAVVITASASALEVTKSIEIAAPPKTVWEMTGGFCTIDDWHPNVEKCVLTQGPKPTRTLSLTDGKTIVKQLQSRDDAAMRYTYTIVEGPLPVSDYTSTLMVTPSGSGSKVTWSASFKAKSVPDAEAERQIAGIYEAGLKGLAEEAP